MPNVFVWQMAFSKQAVVMKDDFEVYYQNVRGLRTKTSDFLMNVLNRNVDVIVLCETWLNDGIHSNELIDNRYIVYRADRNLNLIDKQDGGGCLIAVKSCLYSCRLEDWATMREDMWISVNKSENEKLFINVRYIDYNSTKDQYNVHLKKIEEIMNITASYGQFLLLGDYNLSDSIIWTRNSDDICSVQSIQGKKKLLANALVDMLSLTNLNQFNHIKNNLDSTLDLVVSNICHVNLTVNKDIDPLVVIDVQHPALSIKVNIKPLKYLNEDRFPKFNFFRANYDELNRLMDSIDWESELNNLNIEDATKRYYDLIKTLTVHVPKVKLAVILRVGTRVN